MFFFPYYTPVLILQIFCLVHAYRKGAEQFWYWVIIFFPLIGGVAYLISFYYNRQNIEGLKEGVKTVVDSNYKTRQLEKEYEINDSYTNTFNLANAHLKAGRTDEAIALYNSCLERFSMGQNEVRQQLVSAYYSNGEYQKAVENGALIRSDKTFNNSFGKVDYAWALYRMEKPDQAAEVFQEMNHRYSNYKQRKEYCLFLLECGENEKARKLHNTLLSEIDSMDSKERKGKRGVIREIQGLSI